MGTRSLETAVQRLTARSMLDQIVQKWRFSKSVVLLIGLSWLATSCQTEVPRSPQPTSTPAAQLPVSVPTLATPLEQTASRRTVADYFLAIPPQDLGLGSGISPAERQELLNQAQQGQNGSVYDPNNGYLKVIVPNNETCNTYTIAIFSRPNASPLVAVNQSCTVGDAVKILDPDQNWSDVTATVLPADLSIDPDLSDMTVVILPQFGRTIEVYREDGNNQRSLVGRYTFDGDRFVAEAT